MLNKILNQIKPHAPHNQITQTILEPLILYSTNMNAENQTYMQNAGLYVVVQGKKIIQIGKQEYKLKTGDMICYFTDLPITTKVILDDTSTPYYGLNLTLDHTELAKLAEQMPKIEQCPHTQIAPISSVLSDALTRLVNLLDYPNDSSFLLPHFQAEIHYYLLKSELSYYLRQQLNQRQTLHQINQAIQWIRTNFREPLEMDKLANQVGMSRSNFYLHFKRTTKLSPLQYQKSLKLLEAKRLICTENLQITAVAFHVGYESASQFSREYHHFFGISPKQEKMKTLQMIGKMPDIS